MKTSITTIGIGLVGCMVLSVMGCGIWPVMKEANGRYPRAMGKSDQVAWPWATQPVHLNEDYGISYRSAVESQILNPQNARSLEVVEGIGGMPAQFNMTRYQAMFTTPPYSMTKSSSNSSSKGGGTKK